MPTAMGRAGSLATAWGGLHSSPPFQFPLSSIVPVVLGASWGLVRGSVWLEGLLCLAEELGTAPHGAGERPGQGEWLHTDGEQVLD